MTIRPESSIADHIQLSLSSLPISRAANKKPEFLNTKNTLLYQEEIPKSTVSDEKDDDLIFFEDRNPSNDHEVPSAESSRIVCEISPVSLIMEQNQKMRGSAPLIWEEFSDGGLFGCRLNWENRFWIAPAVYSRKKEARTMAALMACTEIFGNRFIFENIEFHKYETWTKESVRIMSDDLAEKSKEVCAKVEELAFKNDSANQAGESLLTTSSDDKPYVAFVNEKCQKLGIPMPNYEMFSEKCGPFLKFRCSVTNIANVPSIRSNAMPSKKAAKNEVAKQIYEHFKNISKLNTPISPSSVQNGLDALDNDAAIDPKLMVPLVMTLLSQLSRTCYPEMNTLDGIYEMINEWGDFLEWKSKVKSS